MIIYVDLLIITSNMIEFISYWSDPPSPICLQIHVHVTIFGVNNLYTHRYLLFTIFTDCLTYMYDLWNPSPISILQFEKRIYQMNIFNPQ